MKVGLVATIKVQQGKNSEFEAVFTALTEQVLANEEGCVFYALHKSESDPQVYKVLEQYKSADDLKAHGKAEYFIAANQKLAGMIAAAPDIEVLDAV
ncbi:MAG: putative quinol monooxygenase [Arenicella sp.]|jgi:quinol monooxygenase YgiN|nr:putative quinol monooxygenase [Arenicella sp.]